MIRLNRHYIFFIGVLAGFLFSGIHIYNFLKNSEFTKGKLVKWEGYNHSSYPVIMFKANEKNYEFQGTSNLELNSKENIDVIYNKANPENAAVYSFVGFYLNYFLWLVIPIMLYAAFIYSWFDKYDYVTLNFKTKKISKSRELIRKN